MAVDPRIENSHRNAFSRVTFQLIGSDGCQEGASILMVGLAPMARCKGTAGLIHRDRFHDTDGSVNRDVLNGPGFQQELDLSSGQTGHVTVD